MIAAVRSFETFYDENHARVRAALVVAVGEVDLAFEAADEAFARAFMDWSRVSGMDAPRAWVFRVALNAARRVARRRKMEATLLRRTVPARELPPAAGEIWLLVRDLPERQRLAVVLRYLGDLTEEQVAAAMGVTRGTVSRTLGDAQRHLAVALHDETDVRSADG